MFGEIKAERVLQEIKGLAREIVERWQEDAYVEGHDRAFEECICRAIAAFIDLKKSDDDIRTLLAKHFRIDSRATQDKYINLTKCGIVRNRLRDYCLENSMSRHEFVMYINGIGLENKLLANPKLFDMPPAKLKAALDK